MIGVRKQIEDLEKNAQSMRELILVARDALKSAENIRQQMQDDIDYIRSAQLKEKSK